jgi:hypothetical protein
VTLVTFCSIVLLVGCSSLLKTTQTTSSTAKVTAEAAMRSWGRYVEQFHPPVSQELAVQKAFDTYKAAQLTMLDAAIAYTTTVGSTNAAAAGTAQLKLDAAVAGISAALADLLKLLAGYGVNLQSATSR